MKTLDTMLNHLDIHSFLKSHPHFVPVSEVILEQPQHLSLLLELLPKQNIVLQIPASLESGEEVIKSLQQIKNAGYRLAFDGGECNSVMYQRVKSLLPLFDFIKLDVHHANLETFANKLERCKESLSVEIIASNVQNNDDFLFVETMNFNYFQGYFFQQPLMEKTRKLTPKAKSALDMYRLLNSDAETNEVSRQFTNYPDLMINLLQFINSPIFSFKREISSIQEAITIIGRDKLKQWLLMFLYVSNGQNPFAIALFESALIRAKLMQLIVKKLNEEDRKLQEQAFLTGLLSVLPALYDTPPESLFEDSIFEDVIIEALMSQEGYLGQLLDIATDAETEQFQYLQIKLAPLMLEMPDMVELLKEAYLHALSIVNTYKG